MSKTFDFAKFHVDSEAEAHRILNIYIRYMLKKFKFNKYNHYVFQTCPRYGDYCSHIIGLILRSKENLFNDIYDLSYPPSRCFELDTLVKKYIFRKYGISLIYNNNLKLGKNIFYKNFKLSLTSFLKDIITDLKQKNFNILKEKSSKNNFKSSVLIISHDITLGTKVYTNLANKLSKFFNENDKRLIPILPYQIGLTINEKFKNIFFIFNQIIIKAKYASFLKLSDLHFIVLEIYHQIYKNKLKNYFLKNNINLIISSFINYRYESIYYEAARELNIKYYTYDYSLGYPVKDLKYLRYLPDTRKYSDVIFSNSNFRTEQYRIASNFLDKPPQILPHICPQSDFSKINKKFGFLNLSTIKIGIVDNVIFDDCSINSQDVTSLMNILEKSKLKIELLLQSKRGYLQKELRKSKKEKINFKSNIKGDFSNLNEADLIISIGWQSLALKAASVFNKPLLFYSQKDYPYNEHIFSFDKIRNKVINKYCNILWMNEKALDYKLETLFANLDEYKFITETSSNLLKKIGFNEKEIEKYFLEYFK